MIHLGILGLGSISTQYLNALKLLGRYYRLCAVCDNDPNKTGAFQTEFSAIFEEDMPRIYRNSDSLFRDSRIDAVLIATPPISHFDIARNGLKNKKHILLEKPVVISLKQLGILYREARRNGILLHIAYHASFAKDLEWFLSNRKNMQKELRLGGISSIECDFYDPYMENDSVIEEKRSLGGSYMDSGVNALSVCSRLIPLADFTLTGLHRRTDGATAYHEERSYNSKDCIIRIRTGWDMGCNQKTTSIKFSNHAGDLLLDHSNQRVVWSLNDCVLYQYSELPRLTAHYVEVFKDFYRAFVTQTANYNQSLAIHRLLLERRYRELNENNCV